MLGFMSQNLLFVNVKQFLLFNKVVIEVVFRISDLLIIILNPIN